MVSILFINFQIEILRIKETQIYYYENYLNNDVQKFLTSKRISQQLV
ncbi:hypothetical protein pb186bvf_011922 [Paramecium bursaria]